MERNDKGPGFLTGFLLGGIVGAVIGFLFSPQLGQNSREALKTRLKDLVSQAKETLNEAIEEGKEAAKRKDAELRGDLEEEEK